MIHINDLPRFDFPKDEMKLKVMNLQEEFLEEAKRQSSMGVPKKVTDVYGEVNFPRPNEDRPYTFSSLVLSFDGKMAFEDDPQGPFIASKNKLDPMGGLTDFWVLNMLRMYSDAVIVGAKTMENEEDMTAHVFDPELEIARIKELNKESKIPTNVIISFDAKDIPLEHKMMNVEGMPIMIATSPEGADYLRKNFHKDCVYLPHVESVDGAKSIKEKHTDGKLYVISTGEGNRPDTTVMLAVLRQMGINYLVVESPSFTGHLMQLKALDEWFINYSSVYAGGSISPCTTQVMETENHPHADLISVGLHKSNFIFTRQRLRYDV